MCILWLCTFQQIVSNDWHYIEDVFCRQYSEGEAKVSKHHQDVSTSRIPRGFGQVQHRDTFKFNIKIIQMKKKPKQTTTSDHCCLLVFSVDFKIIACGLESSLIWSRHIDRVGYLRTFCQLFPSGISRQDMPHTWLTTYTWVYLPRYLSQVTSLKSWVCPLMITSATLMELSRTSTLSDVFDTSATKAVQTLAITNLPRKCI